MSLAERISNLDTFLAYSVALEEEAAERHDDLADMMDVHNNPEVAETFRKLAHYSRLHAQEIRDHSKGYKLPVIAPWDFGWENMEGPETADISDMNYLMSNRQALKIAMGNEQRAHDFYFQISKESPDPEVSGPCRRVCRRGKRAPGVAGKVAGTLPGIRGGNCLRSGSGAYARVKLSRPFS